LWDKELQGAHVASCSFQYHRNTPKHNRFTATFHCHLFEREKGFSVGEMSPILAAIVKKMSADTRKNRGGW